MKERPILFSGPMVRAIRDGRKTQTRRILKPQGAVLTDEKARSFGIRPPQTRNHPVVPCPYGQPGDRLWVRETWAPHADMPTRAAIYRCDRGGDYQDTTTPNFRWSPSIHMPRWASRITLEIVSVRVERLNDISAEDAELEGCNRFVDSSGSYDARVQFCELWESIHGHGSWDLNQWVWVVEFKEVKP